MITAVAAILIVLAGVWWWFGNRSFTVSADSNRNILLVTIDTEGRFIGTSRAGRAAQWLLPWGPDLIPHPGSMIRLGALRDVGLYDTSLKYVLDLDIFLKLRSQGRFVCTRRSVSAFRWHPESLTVANRAAASAEAEQVKRRNLPKLLQPVSPAWHVPVKWGASIAARGVSRRAIRLSAKAPKEAR